MEVDGDDRDIGAAFSQVSDAGLEIGELFRLPAGTFGEEYKDMTLIQCRLDGGQRVFRAVGACALHGENADDVERKPGQQLVAQEVIGCGDRLYLGQEFQGKQCHQHQGVEVAVMVCDHDGLALRWQAFAVANVEAKDKQHHGADDEGEEQKTEDFGHGCSRVLRTAQPASVVEVPHEMKEQRRGVDQAVDAIEQATVAGNQATRVLDADVAFECREGDIADEPAEADQQTGGQ